MEKLNKQSGLSFIPLYTPSKSKKSVQDPEFSEEEMRKNQMRFECGYDIPNERYEAWLRKFHPEVRTSDASSDSVFSSEEMRKNQMRFECRYDVPNERYEAWLRKFHPEIHTTDASSDNVPLSLSSDEDPRDASIASSSDLDGELRGHLFSGQSSHSSSDPTSVTEPQARHRLSRRRSSSCPRVRRCSTSPSRDYVRLMRGHSSMGDLLNVPSPPVRYKAPPMKSCGRVLTSTDSLRLLQEKEDKKKQEALEKLERQQQREERKRQKEEENRRKEEQKRKVRQQREEQMRQKEEQKRQREEKERASATTERGREAAEGRTEAA